MVKRIWLLPVLLIPVLIAATFPAAVVVPRLDLPPNLARIAGTVWSGSAHWQQAGWQPLDVRWRWQGGREWHWEASGGQTLLQGRWLLASSRSSSLPAVSGQLELDRLDLAHWLAIARPVGVLEMNLSDVVLTGSGGLQAQGQIVWRAAELRGAIQETLGDIEILIDDEEGNAEEINLTVRSLSPASIQVRGSIVLNAVRYDADLWLRAAPGRTDLTSSLAAIGELQPDGQVRLQLGGSTGLQDG
jgi:hypothetical protein